MLLKSTVGCNIMTKHIYLCYVDKFIGSYNPYTGEIKYAPSEKFVDFVKNILKDYPEYSPHNVINNGIESAIREKIKADCVQKCVQSKLNNGKE